MSTAKITVEKYFDICAGHRVVGHEGKCKNLHGHNYRITPVISAPQLDSLGRVVDFSVINNIGNWLEKYFDHKMILWIQDPNYKELRRINQDGIYAVEFNPTAENIAKHICEVVAPKVLPAECICISVKVQETRKCSATYYKNLQ